MGEIPKRREDITAAWLDRVLAETGASNGARVRSVRQEVFGEEGFTGELTRLQVDYEAGDGGAPQTMIAKVPDPDSPVFGVAMAMRLYERESRFYSQLADESGVSVPEVYYNGIGHPQRLSPGQHAVRRL